MPESEERKYRVGMIGVGRQGTHHARAYQLNPSTEVVAGADTDPEILDMFRRRFDLPGYSSYDEMFEKEQIDIAAPVLPVRANADAVVAAARAGVKAIFCEKPLTASLEDADRMVEECRSRGVVFAAGLVPRNYPEYWKAREMIDSGELGEVLSMNLYHDNGQGGCHCINMARHFAGDAEADWVVGWVEGDPFGDTEEEFGGIGGYIRFTNGIEAFSHYKDTPMTGASNIEVLCSRGVLYRDRRGLHLLKPPDGGGPAGRSGLREVEGVFPVRTSERYFDEEGWREPSVGMVTTIQTIVETLDTGARLRATTGDDLRKSLEICIALRESARRGHAPVKLPLEDRSLVMRPRLRRWSFKVETMGRDAYMKDMAAHLGPPGSKQ